MDCKDKIYDVIVIGGGHAGVEAAAAAARIGAKTALITFSRTSLGKMSCNPSVGGLGKGHLVREIDALDGLMAKCADAAALQYRTLNESKGSAVRGLRVQVDRTEYAAAIRAGLEKLPLEIIEGEVLSFDSGSVRLQSVNLKCKSLVVATGTFLDGLMHTGGEKTRGGRVGEPASSLSKSIESAGFSLFRLKTGTPARLDASAINYEALEMQGDQPLTESFSYMNPPPRIRQIICHIARTNARTHEIIIAAREKSPLFNGQIRGVGPRYCPSIEDKVFRFPHHPSHRIFLEPDEGGRAVYPNGISTSLPREVQDAFVRSIGGLENARILQYGYAVEYGAIDARELMPTLQSKRIPSLFFAGQINGTSGYEEAAAQGLLAGANAALFALGRPPLVLDRASSFIGVMVDDITTLGVDEPYRMFTSRSEYRLSLRQDNADVRLTPVGMAAGLVGGERAEFWAGKSRAIDEKDSSHPGVAAYLAAERKYAGYIRRQRADMESYRDDAGLVLPPDAYYRGLSGLTLEIAGKLEKARPPTLAAAARIPGMTPAALAILLRLAKRC